jgi:NMD protein affecting ribosome stability and mRNA decay
MFYMKCSKCGLISQALRDGICPKCDPQFAADLEECREAERRRIEHCAKLYFAMRSRVLTAEEMAEVETIDNGLLDPWYDQKQRREAFNAALLQQFKIRLAAERAEREKP